ncbi:hypothetical protein LLG95_09620 [bacterium]|nr:hypothetical protein [bacterium]
MSLSCFDKKIWSNVPEIPKILGRSPSGEIVNVNISYRNSVAYESEAFTGIMNADVNGAGIPDVAAALFLFGE